MLISSKVADVHQWLSLLRLASGNITNTIIYYILHAIALVAWPLLISEDDLEAQNILHLTGTRTAHDMLPLFLNVFPLLFHPVTAIERFELRFFDEVNNLKNTFQFIYSNFECGLKLFVLYWLNSNNEYIVGLAGLLLSKHGLSFVGKNFKFPHNAHESFACFIPLYLQKPLQNMRRAVTRLDRHKHILKT